MPVGKAGTSDQAARGVTLLRVCRIPALHDARKPAAELGIGSHLKEVARIHRNNTRRGSATARCAHSAYHLSPSRAKISGETVVA